MTAPHLLLEIEGRGGSVAVTLDAENAPTILISPKGLVTDLAPEIRRHKPELIALLGSPKVAPVTHRWQSAAPDLPQLAAEVERARRGHWITPTVPLMALWRAVNAHFGANLTSQQIGALSRLVEANAGATADELHRLCADLIRQGETN